jgi:hypothetical protein
MDPKWWYRAALAALLLAFILMIARVAIVGLRPDTARIDNAVGSPVKPPPARPPEAQ